MKKAHNKLKDLIYKYNPDANSLEVNDFFIMLGSSNVEYAEYDNQVWLFAHQLSIITGKHRTDYVANWLRPKKYSRGNHINLPDLKAIHDFKASLVEHFPKCKLKVSTKTWFVDWEEAYEYLSKCKINVKHKIGLNPERTKVVLDNQVLYISSFEIANQLSCNHSSLMKSIEKYSETLEGFGSLIKDTTLCNNGHGYRDRYYYMLNEDQAYLIGSLARNTENAISFKIWLVNQFSKARGIWQGVTEATNTEEVIQTQLCNLATYSSLKAQAEYPIEVTSYKGNKLKKTIRRIDIMLNNSIAIELKNEKINSNHITEIIGDRGYYHSLKTLPTFKYMIISGPAGCNFSAQKLLEIMHPKLIFLLPHEIGDKIGNIILKEYPKESHWWLKKFLFPKFTRVLSKQFMDMLEEENIKDNKA